LKTEMSGGKTQYTAGRMNVASSGGEKAVVGWER